MSKLADELIAAQDKVRVAKLEAQLKAVRECQRYTVNNVSCTTDNPDGAWMTTKDVLKAAKEKFDE
jgi:hypothetical protein